MITIKELLRKKHACEPIAMLTAYDFPLGSFVSSAGVDMILVGDSGGMTQHGYRNTLPVTMGDMISMTRAVRRAAPDTFLIGDLPFMAYQVSISEAVRNAGRLIKDAGADAVKLEGGSRMEDTVRAIVDAGIAVQGHVGLTPQSLTQLSGYRVQGRDETSARGFIKDCRALQEAGVFSIIFECVPHQLATAMTNILSVPTIGTGSGSGCSGQNLITPDILGLCKIVNPRYVKVYADIGGIINSALAQYVQDVRNRSFPALEHCYEAQGDWYESLIRELDSAASENDYER